MKFIFILLFSTLVFAQTYIQGPALIQVPTTTVSAAGTTTLTNASQTNQQVTGSTTQTIVLPDATTLQKGRQFYIMNRSTGILTVNFNGGSLAKSMAGNSEAVFIVINNASSIGTWDISVPVNQSLTNATGILPILNGGTNNSAFTSGSVLFYDGTKVDESNSKFFWDDTNSRLGIGTSAPGTDLHIQANAVAAVRIETASNTATTAPNIGFRRARGTIGAETLVNTNDLLGTVGFSGYNGSAYPTNSPATIFALATENLLLLERM